MRIFASCFLLGSVASLSACSGGELRFGNTAFAQDNDNVTLPSADSSLPPGTNLLECRSLEGSHGRDDSRSLKMTGAREHLVLENVVLSGASESRWLVFTTMHKYSLTAQRLEVAYENGATLIRPVGTAVLLDEEAYEDPQVPSVTRTTTERTLARMELRRSEERGLGLDLVVLNSETGGEERIGFNDCSLGF